MNATKQALGCALAYDGEGQSEASGIANMQGLRAHRMRKCRYKPPKNTISIADSW